MEIKQTKPKYWIPTLYFAEGMPYIAVNVLSVIFYKVMGLNNNDITFYTSWFYLPWVIKPLWSPLVEYFKNSKFWILFCQFFAGIMFAAIAFFIPTDNYVKYTIIFFWLAAFSSATHDIAADGFYLKALDVSQQAFWVGIRATFYRFSMIFCQGGLVVLAGKLTEKYQNAQTAWTITFLTMAAILVIFSAYHSIFLPKVETSKKTDNKISLKKFLEPFKTFFQKKEILTIITFLLIYRLGEAQLTKISAPFFLDKTSNGGLELSQSSLGYITGTVGLVALILGGILGGIYISKNGLKKSLIPMLLILNIPDVFYVYMAAVQPQNFLAISTMVFVEQFGYGFGFTAYSVYMMYVSQGESSTSHYAVCTAFMAAGMMLPGMISGFLQNIMGYTTFFIWVIFCSIPAVILASKLNIDNFGKKEK